MAVSPLIVCGLPESGKTTFLAALWHLVRSGEVDTRLALDGLSYGQYSYVTEIADTWLRGRQQERTRLTSPIELVGMDLSRSNSEIIRLVFPDHSGETYSGFWESKSCSKSVAEHIRGRCGTWNPV